MGKILPPIAVQLLTLLILIFWVGSAHADKRVALVVGNSQYTKITPRLPNPANDAQDLAEALRSVGFEVILKIDAGNDDFGRLLADFSRKLDGSEITALFFYAGHAVQYRGQNYLLPVDIDVQDLNDVEFRSIGIDRVQQAIDKTRGAKILILDACRDNPFESPFRGFGGPTRGLAPMNRTQGQMNFYATAPGQVARDGMGRNSPFTEALIKRIKEPGVEIKTTFHDVMKDVLAKTERRQRPYSDGFLDDDYYFVPPESDDIAWSRIRDSINEADFKEFIRKFPTSPHARDSQARIDLFERIGQANEEEARRKREREAEEARLKREREALECDRDRTKLKELTNARQKDAIQNLAKDTACPTLKADIDKALAEVERHEEEDRQEREAKLQKQREAEACDRDRAKLKESTDALQKGAIQKLAKDTACPTLKADIDKALAEVARHEEEDRQEREAKLQKQREADACDRDRTKLQELSNARQKGAIQKLAKDTACPTLKADIDKALAEVTAREEEDRKKRVAEACDRDRTKLKELTNTLQKDAIQKLAKETACPALTPDIDNALAEVAAREEEDWKKRVAEEGRQKLACENEKKKLDAIEASAPGARQQYVELQAQAACTILRKDIDAKIKKLDLQAAETQRVCDADRRALNAVKANAIEALKRIVDRLTCEAVRAEAQQRVAALEEEANRKRQICADDKKKFDAIDPNGAGARQQYVELKAQTGCSSLRVEIDGAIKKVDSQVAEAKRACEKDRQALDAIKANDIERLKGAAAKMTCEAVRTEAQQGIAKLEEEANRKRQICANDKKNFDAIDPNAAGARQQYVELKAQTGCASLRVEIDAVINTIDSRAAEAKRACDTDRNALAAVKGNDIEAFKGVVDHLTCEAVRTEAQQRLAKLEDEAKRTEQICMEEKQKLNEIDESAAEAHQKYTEFQTHAACTTLRADVAGRIKKIEERVKDAQTELTRLGCYKGSINGQFDGATRQSLALYHSKKISKEDGDHLTDGLVSELKSQVQPVCPSEPSPPVVAKPDKSAPAAAPETPALNTQQATHEENAQPENKPSTESGGAKKAPRPVKTPHSAVPEEPVSPSPQHRTRHAHAPKSEEPVSPSPQHRTRHARAPRPTIPLAPRMPEGRAAQSSAPTPIMHPPAF